MARGRERSDAQEEGEAGLCRYRKQQPFLREVMLRSITEKPRVVHTSPPTPNPAPLKFKGESPRRVMTNSLKHLCLLAIFSGLMLGPQSFPRGEARRAGEFKPQKQPQANKTN